MKTIRMSLSGLAQNSKKDLLQEVAAFLENSYHGEKDFTVKGEYIVETDLHGEESDCYWSLVDEPVENMYNTFDINLDC